MHAALVVAGLLLLGLDALLIGLNVRFPVAGGTLPPILRLGREFTIPEGIIYLEWLGASAVMARLYRVHRAPLYGMWAAIFGVLLVDDALALHERMGALIARAVDPGVLAYQHVAELAVLLTGGLVILAALSVVWRLTADGPARAYTRTALVLLVMLAGCGVAIDALHALGPRRFRLAFLVAEDGGEMVFATLLVVHAVGHAMSRRRASLRP